jgi:hypothetical protein
MRPWGRVDGDAKEETFVVNIPESLKRKLDLYMTLCPFEISGLGEVEAQNGVLTVTALHLLEQEGDAGETKLSTQDQLEFIAKAASNGVDLSKVKLWWHSHATLESYWSPVDEKTIDSTGRPPWWLSIVGNHREEYLVRLDIFPTPELPLRLTEHGRLLVVRDQKEADAVKKEIKRKVKKRKVAPPTTALPAVMGSMLSQRSGPRSRGAAARLAAGEE